MVKIKQDLFLFVGIVEHQNDSNVILVGRRKLIYSRTITFVFKTS
jgi:hypothetical protein